MWWNKYRIMQVAPEGYYVTRRNMLGIKLVVLNNYFKSGCPDRQEPAILAGHTFMYTFAIAKSIFENVTFKPKEVI